MNLVKDCINFRYIDKELLGLGGTRTGYKIENCRIDEMDMGACPENCSFYEARQ